MRVRPPSMAASEAFQQEPLLVTAHLPALADAHESELLIEIVEHDEPEPGNLQSQANALQAMLNQQRQMPRAMLRSEMKPRHKSVNAGEISRSAVSGATAAVGALAALAMGGSGAANGESRFEEPTDSAAAAAVQPRRCTVGSLCMYSASSSEQEAPDEPAPAAKCSRLASSTTAVDSSRGSTAEDPPQSSRKRGFLKTLGLPLKSHTSKTGTILSEPARPAGSEAVKEKTIEQTAAWEVMHVCVLCVSLCVCVCVCCVCA